jgi:hypothetical protein
MSAPAIIWIVLASIGLLLNASMHGKPKTGVHSFWYPMTACAIVASLLYWGGFFAKVTA